MGIEMIGVVVLLAAVAGAFVLVLRGTLLKNKWGINLSRLQCPRCSADAAFLRKPKSFQQMLWGGFTCSSCGCEMDKWGRDITPSDAPVKAR